MCVLQRRGKAGWLASTALLLSCPTWLFAASPEKHQVLILAPGEFNELAEAKCYASGAAALQKQLLKTGYSSENITLLSGKSATADQFRQQLHRLARKAGPDDLLLIAVASHGVQLGGVDFVCGSDTSVNEVRAIQQGRGDTNGPSTLIPLQEIIQTMSLSASKKRFLLVDTAASRSPLPKTAEANDDVVDRFGKQAVQVSDALWVACSRSGRLDKTNSMTCFMRSVIDGLAGHADDDDDGHVSLFEVSDYLSTFAQAEGYTPPVLHAKANSDFLLAAATESRATLGELPAELRDQLGRAMLEVGKTSLFIDADTDAAINALEQAAQYAEARDVKREAERLLLTAIASKGDIANAWEKAQRHGLPLLVMTQISTRVYQAPQPVGRYYRWNYALDAAVLLEVTELKGTEWFRFGKSYETKDGAFGSVTRNPGWIRVPEFPRATGAANRL